MPWLIIGAIVSLGLASAALVNLLFAFKTNKLADAYFWAAVAIIAIAGFTITLGEALTMFIQTTLIMGKHI